MMLKGGARLVRLSQDPFNANFVYSFPMTAKKERVALEQQPTTRVIYMILMYTYEGNFGKRQAKWEADQPRQIERKLEKQPFMQLMKSYCLISSDELHAHVALLLLQAVWQDDLCQHPRAQWKLLNLMHFLVIS